MSASRVPTHELQRRLERLAEDTGPLGRVAGLGAPSTVPDDVVDALLAAFAPTWAIVDGRGSDTSAGALSDVLTGAQAAHRPLLVVTTTTAVRPSSPLVDLVAAIADQRPLADGSRWPAGRFALVLVIGADTFEQLPPALQRIDFWEFCA